MGIQNAEIGHDFEKPAVAAAAAAAGKSLLSCPILCDPIDSSPPGSPVPGILQARTLGVGCHFLLQCRKVKSESEVSQLCPTLTDTMDCSPPGSSIHGIFQARSLHYSEKKRKRKKPHLKIEITIQYNI